MRLDGLRRLQSWGPALRLALVVWLVLVAVVCVRCGLQPYKRTLYTTWDRAGGEWQEGRDLYHRHWEWHQDQFRYTPLVAALMVPFHHLPVWLGGVVWRLVNAAALLGGLGWWLRRAAPIRLNGRQLGMFLLVVAPLALGSLNNGQPNPLVLGLLLGMLAAAADQRWKTAAGCAALAGAIKVYPLALGLLLAVAYPRRFAGWLITAIALVFALPFALQQHDYVMRQTWLWLGWVLQDHRHGWPVEICYRDLWLLIRVAHLDRWISPSGYVGIQAFCAAGCAVVVGIGRLRGWFLREILLTILLAGSCWMMLCGPATESCTYLLVGPALAWAHVRSAPERWPLAGRWLVGLSGGLLLIGVLAGLFPGSCRIHGLGEQPLAVLLLALAYGSVPLAALRRTSPVGRCRNEASRVSWPEPAVLSGNGEGKMVDLACKLSIVCPVYEEEEVLPRFHFELVAVLASLPAACSVEIIYVDDGSQDGTLSLLRRMAAFDSRIQFLSLSRNFGQQAALTAGMEQARGDVVITLDADMQHPPSVIPALLSKWREGYDIVLTVRADDPRLGYFKRLSSIAFNWVMRWVSEAPVNTGTSDYRLLSRAAVDSLKQLHETHRYLRGMVQWIGFRTTTVLFQPDLRAAGVTKWTTRRLLALAVDAMLSFSKLPLRCSLVLGLLSILLGMGQGAWTLFRLLSQSEGVAWGQEALLLAVLVIGGSILCSLGVLGEYVGRVYEQVKGRPLYLVKETSPRPALAGGQSSSGNHRSARSRQEAAA